MLNRLKEMLSQSPKNFDDFFASNPKRKNPRINISDLMSRNLRAESDVFINKQSTERLTELQTALTEKLGVEQARQVLLTSSLFSLTCLNLITTKNLSEQEYRQLTDNIYGKIWSAESQKYSPKIASKLKKLFNFMFTSDSTPLSPDYIKQQTKTTETALSQLNLPESTQQDLIQSHQTLTLAIASLTATDALTPTNLQELTQSFHLQTKTPTQRGLIVNTLKQSFLE